MEIVDAERAQGGRLVLIDIEGNTGGIDEMSVGARRRPVRAPRREIPGELIHRSLAFRPSIRHARDRDDPPVRRLDDLISTALVPGRCLHCRGPARTPELLCRACRAALPWLPVDGCRRCGLSVACARGRCPAARAAFAAAWAPLAYEGPARSLAWAQKERATARVARWLAAAMVVRGPGGWLTEVGTVVPAPADPVRRRRRGTDHAAGLASAVGDRLDLPVVRALARARGGAMTAPQHELGRRERRRIAMPELVVPVGGTVLLVDDVHTTGATLHAAARALRAGGATRVLGLTAFRAE